MARSYKIKNPEVLRTWVTWLRGKASQNKEHTPNAVLPHKAGIGRFCIIRFWHSLTSSSSFHMAWFLGVYIRNLVSGLCTFLCVTESCQIIQALRNLSQVHLLLMCPLTWHARVLHWVSQLIMATFTTDSPSKKKGRQQKLILGQTFTLCLQ